MFWVIVAFGAGFVVGSFFPQPDLFKGWYDSIQAKYKKFKDKE